MSESIPTRLGRVPEDQKIYQNVNDDDEHYKCPDNFAPIFTDDALKSIDPAILVEAERVCGNDNNCLFDIAATNEITIGESTLFESKEVKNEIVTAGKLWVLYDLHYGLIGKNSKKSAEIDKTAKFGGGNAAENISSQSAQIHYVLAR